MNPSVQEEGVNIGEQTAEEVRPESVSLSFVEAKAPNQVFLGGIQDLNCHGSFLRMSALAVSQSVK